MRLWVITMNRQLRRLIGHAMRFIMDISWAIEWLYHSPDHAIGILRTTLETEVKPLYMAGVLTSSEYKYIAETINKAIRYIENHQYDQAYYLLFGFRSNFTRQF